MAARIYRLRRPAVWGVRHPAKVRGTASFGRSPICHCVQMASRKMETFRWGSLRVLGDASRPSTISPVRPATSRTSTWPGARALTSADGPAAGRTDLRCWRRTRSGLWPPTEQAMKTAWWSKRSLDDGIWRTQFGDPGKKHGPPRFGSSTRMRRRRQVLGGRDRSNITPGAARATSRAGPS